MRGQADYTLDTARQGSDGDGVAFISGKTVFGGYLTNEWAIAGLSATVSLRKRSAGEGQHS